MGHDEATAAALERLRLEADALAREIAAAVREAAAWDMALARHAKGWREQDHPRGDDGRFGTGSGGGKPTAKPGGKPVPTSPRPVRPARPKPTAKPAASPKPQPGKPVPTSPRPSRAAGASAVFAAREQRHAEAQQGKLAEAIDKGAEAIDGSAPSDIERIERGTGALQAVEVKTKLKGRAVRMSAAAQARKLRRLEQHRATGKPAEFHTVALDHRGAYRTEPDLDAAPQFPCRYKRGGGSFDLQEMELVHSPERLNHLMGLPPAQLPPKARPTDRGFWGKYNGTADPKARAAMIAAALASERKRGTGRAAAMRRKKP